MPGARSGFSQARLTLARWVAAAGPTGRHPKGLHLTGESPAAVTSPASARITSTGPRHAAGRTADNT